MKALLIGALALTLVGCESMRGGFSFRTIGTMLDGHVCFLQTKTEAQKDAYATAGLLQGRGATDRYESLMRMIKDPYESGPALCNANREHEGYLHHRSILDGRYE